MANFKSSEGMDYHQPVQKRDPELGPYEAIDSSNHLPGPSMYLESYPSTYVQPSPIIPGVERHNVKMEISAASEGSDVCRVCTVTAARTEGSRNDNMVSIFENAVFADRVAWVLELPMFEGDGLPHHLCSDCRARVDSAFEFKTLAWHSDKLLRQADNTSQQATEGSTYLEDIAQVDLPGPDEEDRPLEDIAQVNVEEERGLRILSCTSLTQAEERLLLSGGLKGAGTKRKAEGRPRKVPPKSDGGIVARKRGKRLKVLATSEELLLQESCLADVSSTGGEDLRTVEGSNQKTEVAERKPDETVAVAALGDKEGEAKMHTSRRGKRCKEAIVALSGKIGKAKITAQKEKKVVFVVANASGKGSTPKTRTSRKGKRCNEALTTLKGEEGEPKITAQKKKKGDFAVSAPGGKESTPKMAAHGEEECDVAIATLEECEPKLTAGTFGEKASDVMDATDVTELDPIEYRRDIVETAPRAIQTNLPSSAGEQIVDQPAVEANESSVVASVEKKEGGSNSPQGSPGREINRDSCDEASTVKEAATDRTKSHHSSEVSAPQPGNVGMEKGKAVTASTEGDHSSEASTERPQKEETATVGTENDYSDEASSEKPQKETTTVRTNNNHLSEANTEGPHTSRPIEKGETSRVSAESEASNEGLPTPQVSEDYSSGVKVTAEERPLLGGPSEAPRRKRGRPHKRPPRKRGRPRKVVEEEDSSGASSGVKVASDEGGGPSEAPRRKRGRPRKVVEEEESSGDEANDSMGREESADEDIAPEEKRLTLADEDIAPEEMRLALADEDIAPEEMRLALADEDIAPEEKRLALADEDIAPEEKRLALADEDIAPEEKRLALADEDEEPEEKPLAPADKKAWSCPDCQREFTKKKDLTAHLTNHGARQPLKCQYCPSTFCRLPRYNTHVRAHKGKGGPAPAPKPIPKVWACEDCSKEFTFKKDLTAHLTNHGTRPTMQCTFCRATYCSLPRYNTHVRTHKGRKTYDCEQCSLRFYRPVDLISHCRVHSAGRTHLCEVCGLALPSAAGLEAHTKTEHTKEKLFKCKVCDKPFTFLGSMKDHLKLKHPEHYVVQCDSCQKTFDTVEELQAHIATHVGVSCYTCNKCNRKFTVKEAYKSHVRNHDRARPYICETCGKSYLNKAALTCHQRTHTGDKPYKCHVCDKAYGSPSALRSHLMSHSHERCYSCSICGKSFRGKETLKRHVVAHSNLREFKCTVCGLEFLHKNNLNRHLDNMHGRLVGTKDTRGEDSS